MASVRTPASHKVARTPSTWSHCLFWNTRTVAITNKRLITSGIANHATLKVARFSTGRRSQYRPTLNRANMPATRGKAQRGWILIFSFLRVANQNTSVKATSRTASLTRIQVMGRACHEAPAGARLAPGRRSGRFGFD
jgi:hypothetical protein